MKILLLFHKTCIYTNINIGEFYPKLLSCCSKSSVALGIARYITTFLGAFRLLVGYLGCFCNLALVNNTAVKLENYSIIS